jgi:lysophospholipase L1-like esterase
VLLVACAGLTGAVQAPAGSDGSGSSLAAGSSLPSPPAGHSGNNTAPAASVAPSGKHAPDAADSGLRTSCQAVAHIGDSTSEGMVSADYLANPAQRLTAQYQDVGVKTVETDISGARSVVETLPGQTNGYQAAQHLTASGFKGCWVLALGTNDTADVAIGSPSGRMQRIQQMMAAAHGQPVLWVNVISLLNSGAYSEANMQLWNQTLQQACSKYKNMRIFNWASLAQPGWFISDGIHYTPAGYAVRAQQIAEALARAFPATGKSQGCTVT